MNEEMKETIESKIHALITDPLFLELSVNREKTNLFETIAVSHLELWHSAFIKWLLDPNSDLGLSDYPIKRFLYCVIYKGRWNSTSTYSPNIDIAFIEKTDFSKLVFINEYTDKVLDGRIDILCYDDEFSSFRMIIENKINSKENSDQTIKYSEFAKKTRSNFLHDLLVYLTPDESATPKSPEFIQITYQEICDYLIKPLLNHPNLKGEHRFLIQQYLSNLSRPTRGNKIMALTNKEICEAIYEKHKDILDEIFLSVKKEIPAVAKGIRKTFDITINEIIEKNYLKISDQLFADYQNAEYIAYLSKDANNNIKITLANTSYDSLSSAAKSIVGKEVNGWSFWSARRDDKNLGTLYDLRAKLLEKED